MADNEPRIDTKSVGLILYVTASQKLREINVDHLSATQYTGVC